MAGRNPNEERPQSPVPPTRVPSGGYPYRVSRGESWGSIANQVSMDAWDLIDFNFPGTRNLLQQDAERGSRQVNWYLREYVGCTVSDDCENWAFSTAITGGAGAWWGGVIYVPRRIEAQRTKPESPLPPPTFGLYFRRYAPFKEFGRGNPYTLGIGGYFAGDNRGVCTSRQVTSRTYGIVLFNKSGVTRFIAGTSGTHFHPVFGDVVVGMSDVHRHLKSSPVTGPDLFGFRASTAGGNPLIKPSPNIDTFVDIKVDFGSPSRMRISGEAFGDNFPNLEIFVVGRSNRTALLLDGQTTGGPSSGPGTRLYTSHESQSLGKFGMNMALDAQGDLAFDYKASPTSLG